MTALARRGHRARQGAAAIAHGRRSWRAALLTGMVAAGASAALATAPIASGATGAAGAHAVGPHLGRAVTVHLPLNAGPGTPIIESASCASATSCTLAGTYSDNTGVDQAMVVSRSGGHWSRAIELQLPANADAGIGGLAESVSCSRAGSCVAVGSYRSNGVFEGFTAAESGGVWHQAKQVRLPANAATTGGASISGVSCTGPGACVLVGNYTDNHGHVRPMVATESKGTWARARELRIPTGASTTGRVLLTSVACPKLGSCAAVGQFDDKSGHARAMAVTESGGTWHQALQLILPKDAAGVPLVSTVSVGCSSAGNCVAVGSYRTKSSKFVPMSVAESRGAWARGQHVTKVPANAAAAASVGLTSIACTRAGTCTAAGNYALKGGGSAALIMTRSGTLWTAATQIRPPAGAAAGASQIVQAKAIGCAAAGFCAIGGTYRTASSTTAAMAATG